MGRSHFCFIIAWANYINIKVKFRKYILVFFLTINFTFSFHSERILLINKLMISNIQEINYHLITGTFKNGFNAWDQVNKLKKLGYKTAKILPKKNHLFKVSVISFKNYDSAVEFQKNLPYRDLITPILNSMILIMRLLIIIIQMFLIIKRMKYKKIIKFLQMKLKIKKK